MTVAAVVVPRDQLEALADAAGRAASRRIVDVAWAGGALPLVVVVDDPDGAVAGVIAGSPTLIVRPAAGAGVDAAWRAGIAAASEAVAGTDGWLLWPGDRTWVDPESVTSLIEAHGARPEALLRPIHDGADGWPILAPASRLEEVLQALTDGGTTGLDQLAATRLDLGDPGASVTLAVPIDDVPDYVGPSAPVAGPPPDWGAAAADEPD